MSYGQIDEEGIQGGRGLAIDSVGYRHFEKKEK